MAAENFRVKKGLEVGTGITANSDGVNVTGIITATQFKGDGSGLTGVVGSGSGVVVKDEGSAVGTAGTINFVGTGVSAALSAGTATVTINSGGLDNVVEDTTPQLGGNLDLNSKFVTGSGGINVTGIVTASSFVGGLPITNGADNRVITATSSSAIQGEAGLTFDGSTLSNTGSGFKGITIAPNTNNSATLRLQNSARNFSISNITGGIFSIADGSDTRLTIDGSGNVGIDSTTPTAKLDVNGQTELDDLNVSGITTLGSSASGSVVLKHGGNQKLTTTINGIEVPDLNATGVGTVGRLDTSGVTLGTNATTFAAKFADDAVANFGTDNDLKIYHNDTNGYFLNSKGQTRFENTDGNIGIYASDSNGDIIMRVGGDQSTENAIVAVHNGEVVLSFNGGTRITTTNAGATVSGTLSATAFSGDGSALTGITASGSGIIVKHDGSTVGTAGTINFSTNLDVTPISAGIVTVTASGGSIAGISTTGTSVFNEIVVGSAVTVNARGINIVGAAITAGTFHADGGNYRMQIGATNQGYYMYNGSTLHAAWSWSSSATRNQFRGNAGGNYPLWFEDFSYIRVSPKSAYVQLDYGESPKLVTDIAGVKITGICTATSFSGSGIGLTSLNADNLGSGEIPNGRFPATLPAVSGANLTALNASEITSGTLPIARIADDAVTFAKIENVGTSRIIGRTSSGTGNIETLSASEVRTLLNVADGATAGITTAPSNITATWSITASDSNGYEFTGPGQDGSEDDPDIYLVRGHKYRFVNTTGTTHPFEFRNAANDADYTDGITGSQSGTQEFNVQHDAPAALKYRCTIHQNTMLGNIYIVGQHLANGANNRVLTATSAYGMNGESGLTYDGSTLAVTGEMGLGTASPIGDFEIFNNSGISSCVVRGPKALVAIMGDSDNSGASETDASLMLTSDSHTNLSSPLSSHGYEIALINDEPGSGLRFHDGTANAERLRIKSNGNIGVGTDNPGKKLHINTTGTSGDGILLKATDSTYPSFIGDANRSATDLFLVALQGYWNGNRVGEVTVESGSDTDNKDEGMVKIRTRNDGDSSPQDRLTVYHTGQVEVHSTTDSTLTTNGALKVGGGIGVAKNIICGGQLEVQNNTLVVTSSAPNILMAVPSGGLDSRIYNDGSGNLYIGHGTNSSAPTERMRFLSDGDIFLGSASVADVHGNSSSKGLVYDSDGGTGNHPFLSVQHGSRSSGNPRYIAFQAATTQEGAVTQSNNGYEVNYGNTSDYRLKENIVDLPDAITRLKTLKPRRYNWIADENNTLTDGFIAHELMTTVPQAVTGTKDQVDENNKPMYQSVDAAKVVPLLTAALQEAVTEIETLKAKVAALEGS